MNDVSSDDGWAKGAGIHQGLRCFVANDAGFKAAVEAGIRSLEVGPTYTLEEVEAEIRGLLHSKA